jgi:hypothetical protein
MRRHMARVNSAPGVSRSGPCWVCHQRDVWREDRAVPIGLRTAAERDRLNRVSAQIPDDEPLAFSSYLRLITR